MTEQNLDLRALREGLPEGLWTFDEMTGHVRDAQNRVTIARWYNNHGRGARAIAAIPSMLAEIERLYVVVENKNEACGLLNDEVERLRALNTEMREALEESGCPFSVTGAMSAKLCMSRFGAERECKVCRILAKTESSE